MILCLGVGYIPWFHEGISIIIGKYKWNICHCLFLISVLNVTNPLQCRGLRLNITSNCFCPRLRNCSAATNNICVRENNSNNTCTMLRNECEMEQAICEGKDITRVDNINCRNFTANTSNSCFCPKLATCNRNSSSICVMNGTQCRLVRNQCELEQAKCEGTSKFNIFLMKKKHLCKY